MKKFLIAAAALDGRHGRTGADRAGRARRPLRRRPAPMAHPMADKTMTRAEVVAMVPRPFWPPGLRQEWLNHHLTR
jgi:hypothetical protein